MLSKQVEDGTELRKQLTETANDLQRQLKNEREENKKSKKRYLVFISLRKYIIIRYICCIVYSGVVTNHC